VSFLAPLPALEENVSYGLSSVAARALVGVGLIDRMKIGQQADLPIAHLGDD
jgi:hypothetical protein